MNKLKRLTEVLEDLTVLLGQSEVKFLNTMLEKGLTSKQVDYLTAISKLGHPSMSDLTRRLRLSNPSITAIIKKFTGLGYVEKTRSEEDGRSFRVRLTPKGEELERMHQQSHAEMAKVLMQNLDNVEVRQLIAIFKNIVGK
jgi:DNA-binding MarR family transcriptional regulator